MATPENTLITRAEFTTIRTPATGRKALVMDGETIELGDTGLRDLSGIFIAGTVAAGRVLVERTGSQVTWVLSPSLTLAGAPGSVFTIIDNANGALNGFRPTYTRSETLMQSESEFARLVINSSGSVAIHFGAAGVGYIGGMSYATDQPWPTTLPGVADGEPVIV